MNAPALAHSTPLLSLHLEEWSPALLADLRAAQHTITIAAHSFMVPIGAARTSWLQTWETLIEKSNQYCAVNLYLAAPLLSHPATLNNVHAATKAHKHGIRCTLLKPPRVLHAKFAVIDNHLTWVGSGNMTAAAHHHNREVWLRCEKLAIASELLEWIENQQ
jgi:phosphatidylserine/phosphatidylglycerophosphate/cardiolipin synthase-like enzyme